MANNNKIDSLYLLIKQKSQEKGRPLKIICDWDETIQPLKPSAIYEKIVDLDVSFETFFETFWEKTQFSPSPSGRGAWEGKNGQGKETTKDYAKLYTGSEKEKEAIKKFQEEKEEMKNSSHKWDSYAKSFYGRPERFEQPFLSPAKDLLLAIKENLIKEIVIIRSYNVGKPGVIAGPAKTGKQQRTFGQFPFTKIEYTPMYKKDKETRVKEKERTHTHTHREREREQNPDLLNGWDWDNRIRFWSFVCLANNIYN